jgi:hypothetical protein
MRKENNNYIPSVSGCSGGGIFLNAWLTRYTPNSVTTPPITMNIVTCSLKISQPHNRVDVGINGSLFRR